jgi:hypothetical protein
MKIYHAFMHGHMDLLRQQSLLNAGDAIPAGAKDKITKFSYVG